LNNKINALNICLILILLLSAISCKEDTIAPELFGSIEGKVIEARQDSLIINISGASVSTAPATTSWVTDANGEFTFADISVGSYTISVTKIGYESKTVTVSVREDQTTSVVIQLETAPITEAPGKVYNPIPENEALDQLRNLNLSWSPDSTSDINLQKFDVYLYDSQAPGRVLLAGNLEDTTFNAEMLDYEKTYYWQVDTKLQDTLVTQGDVWSFTVREQPDYRFFYASNRNGNYDIYNSDSLGIDVIQLTNNPFREWWPRLNSNRRYIAFSSDENIDFHIFKMNRDGSDAHQVTTLPIAGYHNNGIGFSWSPDGGKFLYGHYNQLYTVDENGANLTLIATAPAGRHFRECQFSTFGDKIVVLTVGEKIYDNEIYTMNSNGSNMTLVVDNLPGIVESPSWSIDGNKIMYTHDVSGFESPTGRQLDTRIFIKSLVDTTIVDVSSDKLPGTNDTRPSFSPDGAKIIFENTTNDGFNPKDLWIVDLTGDNRTLLILNAETPDYK
jgi:TolB protein